MCEPGPFRPRFKPSWLERPAARRGRECETRSLTETSFKGEAGTVPASLFRTPNIMRNTKGGTWPAVLDFGNSPRWARVILGVLNSNFAPESGATEERNVLL